MLKIMKAKNKKNSSFTTVELIISITIMFILGGIFLLNYNAQKDRVNLNNALSITSQEVRKAQSLVIAQTALPEDCVTGGTDYRDSFGVHFVTGNNYVSLYVDKNGNNEPDLATNCTCEGADECIERKYFSPSIQISTINRGSPSWISFSIEDLSVIINNDEDIANLRVWFCAKSNCTLERKSILMNTKGMVEIE